MILGLLELQRRALQDHAEKNHSPKREDKTKWRKVKPLFKRITGKPPKPKTQQVFHTKFVFGELGLVVKITTSTKTQQGENQIRTKKYDMPSMQRFELSTKMRPSYSLESPS